MIQSKARSFFSCVYTHLCEAMCVWVCGCVCTSLCVHVYVSPYVPMCACRKASSHSVVCFQLFILEAGSLTEPGANQFS